MKRCALVRTLVIFGRSDARLDGETHRLRNRVTGAEKQAWGKRGHGVSCAWKRKTGRPQRRTPQQERTLRAEQDGFALEHFYGQEKRDRGIDTV
jgi:hypothetical protein